MTSFYKKVLLLFGLLCALTLVGNVLTQSANADNPPQSTKQLAGPPEEILAGELNLPTPDQNAIRSRSAMIPVYLEQTKTGTWRWQSDLAIDNTENLSLLVFSPQDVAWDVAVQVSGQKMAMNLDESVERGLMTSEMSQLGIGDNQYPARAYLFNETTTGQWSVEVTAPKSLAKTNQPDGYLLVGAKSNYKIFSHLNTYNLLTGEEVGLVTYLFEAKDSESRSMKPTALRETIATAEMNLTLPSGEKLIVPMVDDGRHADGVAGDGIFGASIKATLTGDYNAQVVVKGRTPEGKAFIRTSEHFFPVLEERFALAPQVAVAEDKDGQRLGINLTLDGQTENLESVQVRAEVWGSNNGKMVPVAWIGGMVTPEQDKSGLILPLTLDGRWIGRAKVQGDFELRNVVIQDRNTHIPLARLDQVALNVRSLPKSAQTESLEITEEMLMGPKPEAPAKNAQVQSGVLFLVHGYCSTGAWPVSDFTQYGVFADHLQNRTHDEFAQIINSQGSVYPSFGAVASSQGGPATVQLYSFYWSGLDYSSGSRLIQSVGSPYHGSPLAGDIAALGEIFGYMCGANWDLTYDGSSLWLSGIPSWAKSRVYYHTVSFKDVWWKYDYCHLASDILLDDPDDGAVEKWSGQLSGANNLGHKTGWCHTDDMRDPPYSNDHNRNANMNTYGNR